jgi:hypothetical protein
MANPTRANIHTDTHLTNFGIGFVQDQKIFRAQEFAPNTRVSRSTDKFPVWSKSDMLRMQTKDRNSRYAPAPEAEFRLSSDTYDCEYFPLKKLVLDMDRADADEAINIDEAITKSLIQQMMMRREYEAVTAAFTAANWTNTSTGGAGFTKWASSGGDPIDNIDTFKTTVRQYCGFTPNVIIAGPEVHTALRNHSDILARFQYTNSAGAVNADWLAQLFGVEKYIVPEAIQNTAAEAATFAGADIAGDYLLMMYVDSSDNKYTPSAMKTFSWMDFDAGNGSPIIERIESKDPRGEFIKASQAFDVKVTCADAGLLMIDCVT